MAAIFGLDFGTSNSALSVYSAGKVQLVDIDRYNRSGKTLKSVIYYDNEDREFFIGHHAVNRYIENDAYGRYIQSIKSFLPDPSFEQTEIGMKTYKLDELVAFVLGCAKKRGEAFIGEQVDSVVLGRPVVFSEDPDCERLAEDRLLSAAKKAGFKNIQLQYEPIAAALAFENSMEVDQEKKVLVGDFGGGTSDFTIIKTIGGRGEKSVDRKSDVLGLGGVYIGGDTFDSQIMWDKLAPYFGKDVRIKSLYNDFTMPVPSPILTKLRKWHMIPQLRHPKIRKSLADIKLRADRRDLIENLENLIEDNYGYMLFQAIEKSKVELSDSDSATIDFQDGRFVINEGISREDFEESTSADVQKIRTCISDVLSQAGLLPENIDVVFLTGGSSNVRCIKQIFIDTFGPEKIDQENVFTSVAYGLGISGGELKGTGYAYGA